MAHHDPAHPHAAHAHAAPGHAAHGTPEDEYAFTPEGSSYEHTDANVWVISKFGLWLAMTAVIVHVGIWVVYTALVEQAKDARPQQYPLASESRLPPEPRLQQVPAREIEVFRQGEELRLHSYGYVNKEAGVVHIPVSEAMRLTLERGLPSRAEDPQGSAPGPVASDPSAGRTTERRQQ
jgi:hypothetical protein